MRLWGGRFGADLEGLALRFSESLDVDRRMFAEEVWASQAHTVMLARAGLLRDKEARAILAGLKQILEEHQSGKFALRQELEDVHMNVEARLNEIVGAATGGRLHTARSRNNQVVTDARLYVRRRILDVQSALAALQRALLALASRHLESAMPGYTHTQHAQPISLGFWATAHVSAFNRDQARLAQAWKRVNLDASGACALAGTSFPVDRTVTQRLLGFDDVHEHSLDAVGSRDFILEPLACLAMLVTVLSRLSEDLVLWSTYEFGIVELADQWTTGSSIMPQKKNPCMAELARARTGRVFGALTRLLTVTKALPTGYNRDLQEDKEPLFNAFDDVAAMLLVTEGMLRTAKFNAARMQELAGANLCTATEIANYLVREHRLPFRRAHQIVGRLVTVLLGVKGKRAQARAAVAELKKHRVLIDEAQMKRLLDPKAALRAYASRGSSSPAEVRRMIETLGEDLSRHERTCQQRQQQIARARTQTEHLMARVLAGESPAAAFDALFPSK